MRIDDGGTTASAERTLRRLAGPVAERAARHARNRALMKMRTETRRALAKPLGARVADVGRRFRLRRATPSRPDATLVVLTARGLDAGALRGTRDRRPRGVTVPGYRGATQHPRAFVAAGRGGRRRVFERRGRARLPLRAITVPIAERAERLGRVWLARRAPRELRTVFEREWRRLAAREARR